MLEMLFKAAVYYEVVVPIWLHSAIESIRNKTFSQRFKAVSIIYEYHYDTEKRATQILAALISP